MTGSVHPETGSVVLINPHQVRVRAGGMVVVVRVRLVHVAVAGVEVLWELAVVALHTHRKSSRSSFSARAPLLYVNCRLQNQSVHF